jgi:hypothetical protein
MRRRQGGGRRGGRALATSSSRTTTCCGRPGSPTTPTSSGSGACATPASRSPTPPASRVRRASTSTPWAPGSTPAAPAGSPSRWSTPTSRSIPTSRPTCWTARASRRPAPASTPSPPTAPRSPAWRRGGGQRHRRGRPGAAQPAAAGGLPRRLRVRQLDGRVAAITWAADNGADVIVASFASDAPPPEDEVAALRAAIEDAGVPGDRGGRQRRPRPVRLRRRARLPGLVQPAQPARRRRDQQPGRAVGLLQLRPSATSSSPRRASRSTPPR